MPRCKAEATWRITAISRRAERNRYGCDAHTVNVLFMLVRACSEGYKGVPFENITMSPIATARASA